MHRLPGVLAGKNSISGTAMDKVLSCGRVAGIKIADRVLVGKALHDALKIRTFACWF